MTFPEHYPPTDRWKKFFIGVRWLGPDLSFFKDLKARQGGRTKNQMAIWGGGLNQEIAEIIANTLHNRLHWLTPIFLPADKFSVMCHGPKFGSFDDFALEEAIDEIEVELHIKLDRTFWVGLEHASFQEVVNKIAHQKNSA